MAASQAPTPPSTEPSDRPRQIRDRLPPGGLFADLHWRIALDPFPLPPPLAREIESLGRVLLQFYRAANLLYRRSIAGKAPDWVARWLDQGKPPELIAWQRDPAFRNEVPRVIRPDLLLTDNGLAITELDSVPGGIGLTTWLYQAYRETAPADAPPFLGSDHAMREGFAGIFGAAPRVHLVISEESATYRPEMEWLAAQLDPDRFHVRPQDFRNWQDGDAVYRFFELFDLPNVPAAAPAFQAARDGHLTLTPPPKPLFEEKLLLALLWNRHLRDFWRQELGEAFLQRLLRLVPYSWALDPTPIPPHAAIPELGLTDWHQLKALSQRDRDLILKISGYSDQAWGARGVFLGSDLSSADWSVAVDQALANWPRAPHVLQRYHKPALTQTAWFDFDHATPVPMPGRVRLSPYYFVVGDRDAARPHLGGVLATLCPADKKIIHGMRDAVLAPCTVAP
ncbi:MAG: hypothetical protein KF833_20355 [Verrucomicrobiae bacterium]|nr:hypothetical protein [Verrucomicrobiae bacterium]